MHVALSLSGKAGHKSNKPLKLISKALLNASQKLLLSNQQGVHSSDQRVARIESTIENI